MVCVGTLARRIVCWSKVGDALLAGERFGLIKFGSRVDTHLPPDSLALVAVGRQVYGGQTAVARWPETKQLKDGLQNLAGDTFLTRSHVDLLDCQV